MSVQFPREAEVQFELELQLAKYFDHAKRLLRFWLSADKDAGLEKSSLSPIVLRVLLAMSVKSCRQFRSVIELCERAEAADAAIIARGMFETALVVGFVLKRRFVPRQFDRSGKAIKTIGPSGIRLTREFRATLFVTHHVLQPERGAAMHHTRPGMKRHAKRMAKVAALDGVAAPYKAYLGADWTKILMEKPFSYSGLSISNLARSLGNSFPRWYDQVYGSQSEHVHAADLLHHLNIDDEATTPQWHEPVEHVRGTLLTAIAMFYTIVGMLDHHIDFGVVMSTALSGFIREYQTMIK